MNRQRLKDNFLKLLSISSPSLREGEAAEYVSLKFKSMGLEVVQDQAGRAIGGEVGNLIIKIEASNPLIGTPILLNAHLDTVEPCEHIKLKLQDDIVCSDGTTVLGADDKAGVAAIMEAVQLLIDERRQHGPIEIVLTVAEEIGLLGAKNLSYEHIKSKMGFVLDGSGDLNVIFNQAPAQDSLYAKIIGKAAHAGACPEEGINAIQVASEAISKMKLGRIDHETTANVGKISGGVATNIIPEEVVLEGEARSLSDNKLALQVQQMTEALVSCAQKGGATVDIDVRRIYEAFKVPEDSAAAKIAYAGALKLGLKPQFSASGGGSDANVFNAKGIQSVIIPSGQKQPHTKSEYIDLRDLNSVVEYILSIIEVVAELKL